jgi:hypothetical protein
LKSIYLSLLLLTSAQIFAGEWVVREGEHQIEFSNSKPGSDETLTLVQISRPNRETIKCSIHTASSTHRFNIETQDAFTAMEVISFMNAEVIDIPDFISKTQAFIDRV